MDQTFILRRSRRGRVEAEPVASRAGRLVARVVPVRTLDAPTRERMWSLYARYYDGVTRDTFDRDLSGKRDAIVAYDAGDGSLQGFSTLTWDRHRHEGRAFLALFSGDTIVSPEYWGQRALQNAFGRYFTRVKLAHPFTPLYWFLISKGYKTYLLLSRNFPEHWPRHDAAVPAWERGALDLLARERFGDAWAPAEGVVRFERPEARLREDVAPVDDETAAAADVRFFLQANPGHARGDELACLGRIRATLWLSYLAKQVRRRAARRARRRRWAAS
jgi:hypothetical protein